MATSRSRARRCEGLSAMTANGAVTLRDVRAEVVFASARNDAIRMEDVATGALTASTENDDILFSGVEAAESLSLQTDKGEGYLAANCRARCATITLRARRTYDNSLPTLLDGEGIFLRAVTNNGDHRRDVRRINEDRCKLLNNL